MEDLKNVSLEDLIKPDAVKEEVKEKSPLEKMKEMKEKQTGMVINKADITYDDEKKQFKNSVENDRREDEFNSYLSDMDEMIKTAQEAQVIKAPTNPIEAAAMIDQLDLLTKQRLGKTAENPKDVNGQVIDIGEEQRNGTNLEAADTNTVDTSSFFAQQLAGSVKATVVSDESGDNLPASTTATTESVTANMEPEEKEKHDQLVNVLIDKTGFGTAAINFTDEERAKMTSATEIRVTEVETLNIESYHFDAPDEAYVENMDTSDEALGTTTVPLVASRYRAKMKGLGYGQLGDLMLNGSEPTFEQYYKRLSVIYNNIAETTIGKFKSFEDFLKKTAWMDINTLVYGLIVSTYPEVDSVYINCGKCGHQFEQKYFVRDLMDLKEASTAYLEKLDVLMKMDPENYEKYAADSPIARRKYIVMPASKYVVEIGLASAYDYLYTVLQNFANQKFKQSHPDDVNTFMEFGINYMMIIRSISIPKKDNPNALVKYSSFEDMVQIIYRMKPEDIAILNSILGRFGECYTVPFSIKNSVCPRCKNTTPSTEADLNDILFFKIGLLMSTGVKVENMLDL